LLIFERRQEPRQPAGQHGFAGSRRARQQQVMATGGGDFKRVRLSGADFSYANLTDADLSGCEMDGCDTSGAKLPMRFAEALAASA
jgi:uncharacterized protein YjbI with pentapeptide repeats